MPPPASSGLAYSTGGITQINDASTTFLFFRLVFFCCVGSRFLRRRDMLIVRLLHVVVGVTFFWFVSRFLLCFDHLFLILFLVAPRMDSRRSGGEPDNDHRHYCQVICF